MDLMSDPKIWFLNFYFPHIKDEFGFIIGREKEKRMREGLSANFLASGARGLPPPDNLTCPPPCLTISLKISVL